MYARHLTRTIILLTLISPSTGCYEHMASTRPSSNNATHTSTSSQEKVQTDRIAKAINDGDLASAYMHFREMELIGIPKNRQVAILQKYPQLLDGGIDYVRNQARSMAANVSSLTELEEKLAPTINTYLQYGSETSKEIVLQIPKTVYPARIPLGKISVGQSNAEFEKAVLKLPEATTEIPKPNSRQGIYEVRQYTFLTPQNFENQQWFPFWIAFTNSRVHSYGVGYLADADYTLFQEYLAQQVEKKKMRKSAALKQGYDKYKSIYGTPDPTTNEFVTFLIMTTEKLDSGKIDQTEADYLIAQKQSEINERVAAIEREEERQQAAARMHREQLEQQRIAQAQADARARSQMMLQSGLGMLYLNQMQQANQSLKQIQMNQSMQQLTPNTYTVQPLGYGRYRVSPW